MEEINSKVQVTMNTIDPFYCERGEIIIKWREKEGRKVAIEKEGKD